ncbi:NrsF family protein [Bradyrhizobium ganzhouense]|uniref:NrsF family protein n=1 Tax=Bradyrhizobium ganzhouense TaxID=1179767 RepID=UPI003CE8F200
MKTDELIAALSVNVEPVNRRLVNRSLGIALATGTALAIGMTLVALGLRVDLTTPRAVIFLVLKLVFAIGTVGAAAVYLARLARPGGERRVSPGLAALPFVAILLLAGVSLGQAPSSHWDMMVMGDQWLECLISIPIIAIVPFAVVIWAVRQAAPTNLVRAGAFSGLVAGGMSAIGYALHCTDDSLPFVALWYGGTIVLCTLAGAMLGPRLLRW